jgi:hypothetical protein
MALTLMKQAKMELGGVDAQGRKSLYLGYIFGFILVVTSGMSDLIR